MSYLNIVINPFQYYIAYENPTILLNHELIISVHWNLAYLFNVSQNYLGCTNHNLKLKKKLKIWETSIRNLDLDTLGFTRSQFSSLSEGLWRRVNFSPPTKEIRTWFLYRQLRLRNNIYKRESVKRKRNIPAFHPDKFPEKNLHNSKWALKKTYIQIPANYDVHDRLWSPN